MPIVLRSKAIPLGSLHSLVVPCSVSTFWTFLGDGTLNNTFPERTPWTSKSFRIAFNIEFAGLLLLDFFNPHVRFFFLLYSLTLCIVYSPLLPTSLNFFVPTVSGNSISIYPGHIDTHSFSFSHTYFKKSRQRRQECVCALLT